MSDRLARGLATAELPPVWPAEANEVFVALPNALRDRLQAASASFYPWITASLPPNAALARDATLVRLVTSFATQMEEVDQFVGIASGK
jgi:threonine aldolase